MSGEQERAQKLFETSCTEWTETGWGRGDRLRGEIEDSLWLFDPYFSGVGEVTKHSA